MLRLAIDTHLITSHFALPLLIREPGGLVVEMTDGTREYNDEHYRAPAFYDLVKNAVIRLAFAQAQELAEHGCTAVALTPGWMRSEMMLDNYQVTEETWREAKVGSPHFVAISESPRFVGRAVAALAADPDVQRRNGGSFSSGGLAREYGFTDPTAPSPTAGATWSRSRTRASPRTRPVIGNQPPRAERLLNPPLSGGISNPQLPRSGSGRLSGC